MDPSKIYPYFLERIQSLKNDDINSSTKFRVLISFNSITDKEDFIQKYMEIEILASFNVIPSILCKLGKEFIMKLSEDNCIKTIEEDQQLFLSILDVHQIIELDQLRTGEINFTGKGVDIGIIDEGIQPYYESIDETVIKQYSLEDSGIDKSSEKRILHGTIMTSIIANQFLDYYDELIGIAPDAKTVDFNIKNNSGIYHFSDVLRILDLIIERNIFLDILLISLISKEPSDGEDLLCKVCEKITQKGIIIINPAGNLKEKSGIIGSPSSSFSVISVGALNKRGEITPYSGRSLSKRSGIKPDIFLPGDDIRVPITKNLQPSYSGTSIAAAVMCGIIALLKEADPRITQMEVKGLIEQFGRNVPSEEEDINFKTISILHLFDKLGLYERKIVPYPYITKRAFKFSIEILTIFILLFYLSEIMNLINNIITWVFG